MRTEVQAGPGRLVAIQVPGHSERSRAIGRVVRSQSQRPAGRAVADARRKPPAREPAQTAPVGLLRHALGEGGGLEEARPEPGPGLVATGLAEGGGRRGGGGAKVGFARLVARNRSCELRCKKKV